MARVAVPLARAILLAAIAAQAGCARAGPEPGEDFFPAWAANAEYNEPLWVRDTDGAIGRLSLHPKRLRLEDLARVHGHLCDGLVIAWVELGVALRELFPERVVDRTDLRAVSKNGPCWADAAAWMTGARVNHGTLILDRSVGDGFIVQRVSTRETVHVRIREGVYPTWLAQLEGSIRNQRARGEDVRPEDIDRFEAGAAAFSRRLLETAPQESVAVERLDEFAFPEESTDPVAPRSDVINRDQRRVSASSSSADSSASADHQ